MADSIKLGAPGIYFGMPEAPLRALTGVRMDVCAFVGAAPRGAAREPIVDDEWSIERGVHNQSAVPIVKSTPVAVQSFDEYKQRFGEFEGPGLLPYAVSSFFGNGGSKAYIVRVVHKFSQDPTAPVQDPRDRNGEPSYTTDAPATATTTVRVADCSGFGVSTIPIGGIPKMTPTSASFPLAILVGGVACEATAVVADDASAPPSGPGKITITASLQYRLGDSVVRADGPCAVGAVPGIAGANHEPVLLRARNEGSWGNQLQATLTFQTRPVLFVGTESSTEMVVPPDAWVPIGSLLRITDNAGARTLHFVLDSVLEGNPTDPDDRRRVTVDSALPAAVPLTVEVVEGTLTVVDGVGTTEVFDTLGLSSTHERWMAEVIAEESELVYPHPGWVDEDLVPSTTLLETPVAPTPQFFGGADHFPDIALDDFFDPNWTPGDDQPGVEGVHSLTELEDLSLLVVPDLYSPNPIAPVEPIVSPPTSFAGGTFAPCVAATAPPRQALPIAQQLDGLALDPETDDGRKAITAQQLLLIDLVEELRSFIVLLDVPPRLHQRQILSWRAQLRSEFAAAYHPWIAVTQPDDDRGVLVRVNPSAVAAGIIARQEARFGVPHGPANALASDVVSVDDVVSPARHDELHQNAINVYLRDVDGIRLTAARTLSSERDFRQLSVRRLVTMIARTLDQQCQWLVFEPNNALLRRKVRAMIGNLMSRLFRANAFRGASEKEAFFVRCDTSNNTSQTMTDGKLICEVGIAPAEPLEFIVVRLIRDDSNLQVVD